MNKKIKKPIFIIYSDDEIISKMLNELKENQKLYGRLESGLKLIGKFDGKYKADILEIIKHKEDSKIKAGINDDEDNVLIFYLSSSDKSDSLKITKIANEEELVYDIALAKKFPLNKDNIELTRAGKVFNFKYGRLVTDDNNFYTVFINNDLGYQVIGDFNSNLSIELLEELNKLENPPKLIEYINIIDSLLRKKDVSINGATITAFKEMNVVEKIKIGIEEKNNGINKKK